MPPVVASARRGGVAVLRGCMRLPALRDVAGHSLGGDYVVAYTDAFPSEVVGVTLVDASIPSNCNGFVPLFPGLANRRQWRYRWKVALAWTGVMRFDCDARTGVPHQPTVDIEAAAAYTPRWIAAMLREEDAMRQTLAIVGTSR